ncbi:hypothetical protein BS17DRAFT_769761 [Gyrodon lividus]|nr:hypothetical protein BS17DRAFT_769761 [Gyrodon lividus]
MNFPQAESIKDYLSFKAMESLIKKYTGVEYILHNMCEDSCMAFTGPFYDCNNCPTCGKSHWDTMKLQESNSQSKVPIRKFPTILLGPQLQARYCDPQSACDMHWLHNKSDEIIKKIRQIGRIDIIEDIAMGWDFLGVKLNGDIKPGNIFLLPSMNGAQLYEDKELDYWMYIWIFINLSPDKQY